MDTYKRALPGIIILIAILVVSTIYWSGKKTIVTKPEIIAPAPSVSNAPENATANETTSSSDVVAERVADGFDAFSSSPSAGSSNVVGYFASGGFVMYLPDWTAEHWMTEKGENPDSLVFVPRIAANTPRDYSDIDITVNPTDELMNAAWLYEKGRNAPLPAGSSISSEVMQNEVGDMRIYHITTVDANKFYETFFLDGNGKTAIITFSANKDAYLEYSTKVKELVRGIGIGKEQG